MINQLKYFIESMTPYKDFWGDVVLAISALIALFLIIVLSG